MNPTKHPRGLIFVCICCIIFLSIPKSFADDFSSDAINPIDSPTSKNDDSSLETDEESAPENDDSSLDTDEESASENDDGSPNTDEEPASQNGDSSLDTDEEPASQNDDSSLDTDGESAPKNDDSSLETDGEPAPEEKAIAQDENLDTDKSSGNLLKAVSKTYYEWFPDKNFATAIAQSQSQEPTDTVTDTQLAGITTLSCVERNISDLAGIENLPNLDRLLCARNNLTSIDTSHNPKLTVLDCSSNKISSINVTKNAALKTLDFSTNDLPALDVSQNISLTTLDCDDNQMTSIDVSSNTNLTSLILSSNNFSSVDVSQNTKLTILELSYNNLSSVNVSQNTALTSLSLSDNKLSSIDISKNINLTSFTCSRNPLHSIDISKNTKLKSLYAEKSQLTSLDCSSNRYLQTVWISGNELTTIDFSNNKLLSNLKCTSNHIQDFSSVPDGIRTMEAQYQSITLPTQELSVAHVTLPVSDQLKSIDGTPLTIGFDATTQPIPHSPSYDSETNTITWRDIYNGDTLTYMFSGNQNITGTFYIPVTLPLPTLICDDEITYPQGTSQNGEKFLNDIHAETDSNSRLYSQFDGSVNMSKVGDYQVLVTARSLETKAQTTKYVTVHVCPPELGIVQDVQSINFDTTAIQSKETLIKRENTDPYTISVTDSRGDEANWIMKMSIEQPLTTKTGDTLNNAFIYRDDIGTDTRLSPNQSVIIGTSAGTKQENNISHIKWSENEGLLIKTNLSKAKSQTYTAKINWTLENTPMP
ncbi:WxL domain-containing protein [Listeria ilorinensis]|uniref:WxL domain-containing protein n=1 Tax=Listeria ilorinensis TaxID=2867439 RepID=UPI001EF4E6E6|nr:WxL domain-containing protein [Listeria ilorinensis]